VDLTAEGRALAAAVTGGLVPASVRVRAGALDLHCLVWGGAGDPTAILIHGNGAHAHWWDALVAALVPGWRLVAVDLRGHGESTWPEPPSYRVEDLGADLDAVVAECAPGRIALVGHSMGGRLALWWAAHHRDAVRGLAILDSRLDPIRAELAARHRGSASAHRTGRTYPTRAAALEAFRLVPDEPGIPDVVRVDLAHHAIVERRPGAWEFRFDRAVLSLEGDGARDLLALGGRLRCPIVLMAGDASWVMDAEQREVMTAAMPHASWQVFPGSHHFLLAQGPAVGAALRSFLDGLA
jgi:pimeloyl-ACP methyl ester carboxylesterase